LQENIKETHSQQLPLHKTLVIMKKIGLLVILALVGVLAWWLLVTRKKPKDEVPDQPAVAVSKYSPAFINSVDTVLNNYYLLSETLVNWDSSLVPQRTKMLEEKVSKLNLDELKKDTVVYQTAITYTDGFKTSLASLQKENDITAQRRAFQAFSQSFYDLLRVIKYDGSKIYMQECPMAFNDTETAMWLSKTGDIRNPYLGLHHPKYKSGMLECGEVKDSLTFITQQN
jgi:hypothetical protein